MWWCKMPFDVILTPRKCVAIAVLVVSTIFLFARSFVNDLNVDRTERRFTPFVDSRCKGSTEDSIFKSVKRRIDGPQLGRDYQHIHWFVQISDVHISLYYDHGRATDLFRFCVENLKIIQPEVVLLTGDITDAKHIDKEGSTQFEAEWKQYDHILHESGILEKTIWLDTRGNHDAFDVPSLTSHKNYFKIYSAHGKHSSLSYHYKHKTDDGDSISFISIDACPNPGPKRPFNFFGLVYESEFNKLQEFIRDAANSTQTIFFGHYPTSTIGSPHPGIRELLGHGSVYLCGHLHTMAGLVPNMYAMQQTGYLELELADWRDQRSYRLLAIDHGLISFIDLDFHQWPVILVTNPKKALFLLPDHEPTCNIEKSSHVRILIFSKGDITAVAVTIDGTNAGEVEHISGPLFTVAWEPSLYATGLHTIEVSVRDSLGYERELVEEFSIDGSHPSFDLRSRFLLMSDHSKIFRTLFWVFYALALLPLLIVKFIRIRVQAIVQSRVTGYLLRFLLCWLRRFYLISSAPNIYYPLLAYNIYIVCGPWFIGEILEGHIGACFLFGIFVQGTFIPGTLTYLYGTLQLIIFSIPLTLYLGHCLDLSLSTSKESNPLCPSRLWILTWLLNHSCFLVIVTVQFYLVMTGFYKAYGLIALVLCPVRTWALLLAIYLRKQTLRKSYRFFSTSEPAETCQQLSSVPATHSQHSQSSNEGDDDDNNGNDTL